MPMYEYQCQSKGCGETITVMQKMGAGPEGLRCPACEGGKLKKLISAPTVIDPDRGLPSESAMRGAMSDMQKMQSSMGPCASGSCGSGNNTCSVKEFGGGD